jgi:hypothetical protein
MLYMFNGIWSLFHLDPGTHSIKFLTFVYLFSHILQGHKVETKEIYLYEETMNFSSTWTNCKVKEPKSFFYKNRDSSQFSQTWKIWSSATHQILWTFI